MGQLTGKHADTSVEIQKTLFLWEVLQEYKSPGIMLSLDINGQWRERQIKRKKKGSLINRGGRGMGNRN